MSIVSEEILRVRVSMDTVKSVLSTILQDWIDKNRAGYVVVPDDLKIDSGGVTAEIKRA